MVVPQSLRILITLAAFVGCSVLFFLPGDRLPEEEWMGKVAFDKLVHIGLFAMLSWLVCWSFSSSQCKRFYWIICASLIGYGIAVEVIQGAWIAGRSADFVDVICDAIGVVTGILVCNRTKK